MIGCGQGSPMCGPAWMIRRRCSTQRLSNAEQAFSGNCSEGRVRQAQRESQACYCFVVGSKAPVAPGTGCAQQSQNGHLCTTCPCKGSSWTCKPLEEERVGRVRACLRCPSRVRLRHPLACPAVPPARPSNSLLLQGPAALDVRACSVCM